MRLRPPALCHQTGGPCCPAPWAQLAACPPGPRPRSPGGAHAAPHPPAMGLLPSCVPSLCWGCRGGPYIQQKPHHIGLAAQRRLVQGRARLGLPVDVDASLQQEPAGARRGQRGGGGHGAGAVPAPHGPGHPPDDVDVAVLGREVQGAGAVGVGGVPRLGLQQRRAHVAVQEQLDHLDQQTQTEQGCKDGSAACRGCRAPRTDTRPAPGHPMGRGSRRCPPAALPEAALCPPPGAPYPKGLAGDPPLPELPLGAQHCGDSPRPGQTRTPSPAASSPSCP